MREHFQCNSLAGAELEDDGGDGTAGSHWEQRLFEGIQHLLHPLILLCVAVLGLAPLVEFFSSLECHTVHDFNISEAGQPLSWGWMRLQES